MDTEIKTTPNAPWSLDTEILTHRKFVKLQYLRKSTDRKAQIRKAFVQFSGLICALRSVDFSQVRFITPSHLTHNLFFYFQ